MPPFLYMIQLQMRKTGYDISIPLIVFLFLCIPANAQSDVFTWTYINVDIEIQENGDLLVSEEQKYSFKTGHNEQWHARHRWLPMGKIDDIEDVEVYELARNGEVFSEPLSLTHKIQKEKGQFWIWWWHELSAPETRTFLLKYRVIGGLHINKPTDELNWEAVFGDHRKIEKRRVRVHLPPPLWGKAHASTGSGLTATIQTSPDGSTVEYNTSLPSLGMGFGLVVRVSFPHRILKIKKPKWQTLWGRFWDMGPVAYLMLLVALLLGIGLTKSIVTGDWSNWEGGGSGGGGGGGGGGG